MNDADVNEPTLARGQIMYKNSAGSVHRAVQGEAETAALLSIAVPPGRPHTVPDLQVRRRSWPFRSLRFAQHILVKIEPVQAAIGSAGQISVETGDVANPCADPVGGIRDS